MQADNNAEALAHIARWEQLARRRTECCLRCTGPLRAPPRQGPQPSRGNAAWLPSQLPEQPTNRVRAHLRCALRARLAPAHRFNAESKRVKKLFAASAGRITPADEQERENRLAALKKANESLYDQLMEIELMQVDQFIAAIDAFEINYMGMHTASLEAISSTFLSLRDMQVAWVAEAHELAALRHDKFVEENEAENDEVSDELKAVLNDKEGMITSIDNAREARISFLDATEDALAKAETAAFHKVINDMREAEHSRNRERVNEISHLVRTINNDVIDELYRSMDGDES